MKTITALVVLFGLVSYLSASQCSYKKYETCETHTQQKSYEKLLQKVSDLRKTLECAKKKKLERAKQSATLTQKVLTESYLISDLAKLCADYIWVQEKTQVK